jgi:pilus assembly protein CpaF
VRPETFDAALRRFLAPVWPFLEDASVSEVMINGHDRIYVEMGGRIRRTKAKFGSPEALLAAARSIAQYSDRYLDERSPRMDGRLPDGSRVHVVIPPCALTGITVAIRKFSKTPLDMKKLLSFGALSGAMGEFLHLAVLLRKNILVSGGTGSGKTSLLNALSGSIPEEERIVVIEDTSELRLQQEHVVRLEARPPDEYGKGRVTIRDLFHSSLRLRPDRILIGECRGGEALDMIQAMTSGHEGSMTTLHANNPRDALRRLETMALQSDVAVPLVPLRAQVASAVDLIVQQQRFADGARRIVAVSEVLPLSPEGDYHVMPIFRWVSKGRGEDGKVAGGFAWTQKQPSFAQDIEAQGLEDQVRKCAEVFGTGGH